MSDVELRGRGGGAGPGLAWAGIKRQPNPAAAIAMRRGKRMCGPAAAGFGGMKGHVKGHDHD